MRHGTFHHSKPSRTFCPVRPGLAGGLAFIILLACTVGAFGAMIQVTPCEVGADNNGKYDRNPSPDPVPAGDANCDNAINVGDVVHIVNYVFKGGPEPCCP